MNGSVVTSQVQLRRFFFFPFPFFLFLRGLSASAPLLDTAGRRVSAFDVKTSRRTRFRDASVRRVMDEVLNPKGVCCCSIRYFQRTNSDKSRWQ